MAYNFLSYLIFLSIFYSLILKVSLALNLIKIKDIIKYTITTDAIIITPSPLTSPFCINI